MWRMPLGLWPLKPTPNLENDGNAQTMPEITNIPTINDEEETEDMPRRQRHEANLYWARANAEYSTLDWFAIDKELTRLKKRDFLIVTQPLTKPQGNELTDEAFELANALIAMPGITLVAIGTYEVYIETAPSFVDISDSIIETFEDTVLADYEVNTHNDDYPPTMPESLNLTRNCIFVGASPAVSLSK